MSFQNKFRIILSLCLLILKLIVLRIFPSNLSTLYFALKALKRSRFNKLSLVKKNYISDPLLDYHYIDFTRVNEYFDDLMELEAQIEYEFQRDFKEFMYYNKQKIDIYNTKGKYFYAYCYKTKGDVSLSNEDYKIQFFWPSVKGMGDYFDAILFLHRIDMLDLPYVYIEIRSHLIFVWLKQENDVSLWLNEKILGSTGLFVKANTFQWSKQSLFGAQVIDISKYTNLK